jgi:hypothetical protein
MVIIADDIAAVVASMRRPIIDPKAKGAGSPYFMFGHRREIDRRLLEKNEDKVFKYQKYPLIALAAPITERLVGNVIECQLNIAILAFTDKNYNAEERLNKVFKPILYPLYELFLERVKDSGLFMWDGEQDQPEHDKIDRFYYGTQFSEGTETSIFTDPLDAIELVNLRLYRDINAVCPSVTIDSEIITIDSEVIGVDEN